MAMDFEKFLLKETDTNHNLSGKMMKDKSLIYVDKGERLGTGIVMNRILAGLKARGLYRKDSFPYRRGCIEPHEKLFGPLENWFNMKRNFD